MSRFQRDITTVVWDRRPLAPASRIILLTGLRGAELQARALRLDAKGFVPKEQSAELLLRAIRKVRDGELWFDPAGRDARGGRGGGDLT